MDRIIHQIDNGANWPLIIETAQSRGFFTEAEKDAAFDPKNLPIPAHFLTSDGLVKPYDLALVFGRFSLAVEADDFENAEHFLGQIGSEVEIAENCGWRAA
ncbi:MAG TPA: hypothetical protein VG944_13135 [Fimbriimonas sp.]|nr:hypothetical protein [Fimbriimonas sp.]